MATNENFRDLNISTWQETTINQILKLSPSVSLKFKWTVPLLTALTSNVWWLLYLNRAFVRDMSKIYTKLNSEVSLSWQRRLSDNKINVAFEYKTLIYKNLVWKKVPNARGGGVKTFSNFPKIQCPNIEQVPKFCIFWKSSFSHYRQKNEQNHGFVTF